jgi:hypothetical protein
MAVNPQCGTGARLERDGDVVDGGDLVAPAGGNPEGAHLIQSVEGRDGVERIKLLHGPSLRDSGMVPAIGEAAHLGDDGVPCARAHRPERRVSLQIVQAVFEA